MTQYHKDIYKRLEHFHKENKIPNIIFHGDHGVGKTTIVDTFIQKLYNNNKDNIRLYVMNVNCSSGKGIKFIRDELKLFAKTNIASNMGVDFKSIVLKNAEFLTMDAQSALRRCIELFSHSTRFFIIVENKYKLLKPILSRLCDIYVPSPNIRNKSVNLYIHAKNKKSPLKDYVSRRNTTIMKCIKKMQTNNEISLIQLLSVSEDLYQKGISCLDIQDIIVNDMFTFSTPLCKYETLMYFQKIRSDFRCEKLLIFIMLKFILLRKNCSLENRLRVNSG